MNNVLIVDDDSSFLLSLSDGLRAYSDDFSLATYENGQKAIEYLSANPVALVVTDLKMPVIDGFELLAHIGKHYPQLPVIVMTAFGTPSIEESIHDLGAMQYIEKPLDFKHLAKMINEGLASSSSGHISNMNLVSFLQLIEMEKKTCTLSIKEGGKRGVLYFKHGVMFDAETSDQSGVEAAYVIVCWKNAEIEISSKCRIKESRIESSLQHIIMDAAVRFDELSKNNEERRSAENAIELEVVDEFAELFYSFEDVNHDHKSNSKKGINIMSIQDKLKEFASIDGFLGAGVFTPAGETIGLYAGDSKVNLESIGILANNVLMNAQKASIEMGTGRGQLVHVEAEHAHIIVCCLNEGTDPLKSQPGKAHIHLVLILGPDASLGLAKMRISAIVLSLADDCRV
jgi:CheY-like chemotaxis protein/predicted regulator of Ras-like GTPase activity (Roadblock/LC7/MglB family)